jgi:transposase-like protein
MGFGSSRSMAISVGRSVSFGRFFGTGISLMDMNLLTLARAFDSDNKCRQYLEELAWPDGVRCPRCQSDTISRIEKRNQYDCDACRYQFSVTTGTIFHDTHLPLWKWFAAVYLMCESKKSISANQIKRTLVVAYKTAWYLCHRIRKAMEEVAPKPLKGTVEYDETFVGGKVRGMGRGYRGNKTAVLGALERGGPVRFKVEKHVTAQAVERFLKKTTGPDTEQIFTDEHPTYAGVDFPAPHDSVNHSAEEWVRGEVHTNSVESAWSLFKRSIIGSYHHLSEKHLAAYLDEQEFRFNNRKNPYMFRDTLKQLLSTDPLSFDALVKSNAA